MYNINLLALFFIFSKYIFFFSSGVIWETKKLSGSRYKPMTQKECDIIEVSYIRYTRMLAIGENEPIVFIRELNIEVFIKAIIFYLTNNIIFINCIFR